MRIQQIILMTETPKQIKKGRPGRRRLYLAESINKLSLNYRHGLVHAVACRRYVSCTAPRWILHRVEPTN